MCGYSGCPDPFACNYSGSELIEDDGSCIISNEGCTDPEACNYSSDANTDDGSCEYTSCAGCMDDGTNNLGTNRPTDWVGVACNYQNGIDYLNIPEAVWPYTVSDPSACEYTSCVGCMDDGTGTNPGTNRPSNHRRVL